MGNADLEMEKTSTKDKDKSLLVNESDDKPPPPPPKRDYLQADDPEKKANRFSTFQRPEFIAKPDWSGNGMGILKSLLVLFNIVIWAFGVALLALGIWIMVDKDFFDMQSGLELSKFKDAGTVLIVAGAIIMLVGFLGCYGACALKLWMLVLYTIIITVIIVMEIAVMALVWTASNNKEVEEDLKAHLRRAIQYRHNSEAQQYLIDLIQNKLECCGVDGVKDYDVDSKNLLQVTGQDATPESCMNRETGVPQEQGCLSAVIDYLKSKANLLGGIAITVFALQLAALVFTVCIACSVKHAVKNEIF